METKPMLEFQEMQSRTTFRQYFMMPTTKSNCLIICKVWCSVFKEHCSMVKNTRLGGHVQRRINPKKRRLTHLTSPVDPLCKLQWNTIFPVWFMICLTEWWQVKTSGLRPLFSAIILFWNFDEIVSNDSFVFFSLSLLVIHKTINVTSRCH